MAIDPAPFRGVLPLPISALRVAGPGQPGQPPPGGAADLRPVPVRLRQRSDEDEAKQLYETFAVPAAGRPLFQGAAANLNPWTKAKVDTGNPDRGPMLLIAGGKTTPRPRRSPVPPTSTSSATLA